jgi:hypothetical protein
LSREHRCPFFWLCKPGVAAVEFTVDELFELVGLSNWRCWSVDFRNDDERFGIVLKYVFIEGSPYRGDQSISSRERRSSSPPCRSDSNMLKSELGPWRLRLFAEGLLPKLALSMAIDPSLRFIGLAAVAFDPKFSLRRFSALDVVILGAAMKSNPSSFSLSTTRENVSHGYSHCASVELRFLRDIGGALPPLDKSAKGRLEGLFGEVLVLRERFCDCTLRRKVGRLARALGG